MSIKSDLIKKVETQMNAWQEDLNAMRAQAKSEKADAENAKLDAKLRQETAESMQSLEQKIREAGNKLDEIKASGEDKLEELQKDVKSFFDNDGNSKNTTENQQKTSEAAD